VNALQNTMATRDRTPIQYRCDMTFKLNLSGNENFPKQVGYITKEILSFMNLQVNEGKILLSEDKIKYFEKHKQDFKDDEEFYKHIRSIPEIIASPDYIGIHPDGNSIEFIKEIDRTTLVAIRINNSGVFWVKSVFPISEGKLLNYQKSGRVKKRSK
jgi:hypothetical protein